MEKRELINELERMEQELDAAKGRLGRAEFLTNEILKKLQGKEIIKDPRLDEIIGVLNSIVIELKNIRGKQME